MSRITQWFVLLDEQGHDTGVLYSSHRPSGAAMKAAADGCDGVMLLREQNASRVHVFENVPYDHVDEVGETTSRSRIKGLGIVGLDDVGRYRSEVGTVPKSVPAPVRTAVALERELSRWMITQPEATDDLVNIALRLLRDTRSA